MNDKRPWTPGPWSFKKGFINPVHCFEDSSGMWQLIEPDKANANLSIAKKAPEMAEILIELAELDGIQDEAEVYWPLCKKAIKLLKEIGYETPS